MKKVVKNIKELVQVEEGTARKRMVGGKKQSVLPVISDAWLLIEDGRFADFGTMKNYTTEIENDAQVEKIDGSGRMVFPTWCDSHTHLVFPGSREIEYIDKIKGLSYEDIAKRGGGILNSAKKLHDTSEEELMQAAYNRIEECISYGTGAIEIKSGYGLTLEDELKMLRVIKQLKTMTPATLKASFLGAHAIPKEYKGHSDKYVDLVIEEMLPRVADEELADFIDVFCDRGFFSVPQTERILDAAAKYGLQPKLHANELDYSGGIQVGVKYNARSVDHLEYTGDKEIEVLQDSATMPTILPGAAFFLNLEYAPARKMIDAGLPVAMASDFNPGSSPSGNMQFILSMGSIVYRMLPEEGINAVTLNSAYAMGVEDSLGTIARGKKANFFITHEIPSIAYMPYAYGSNKVERVYINGDKQ